MTKRDTPDRTVKCSDRETTLLLKRYGDALRTYFRRRVNACDVDDLVQEALVRIQTSSIDNRSATAEGYIFTVARNILIDRHRSVQRRDLSAYETYVRISGTDDPLSPERILLAREEVGYISRAIRKLPPRARAAFEFQRFDHMTYREIAGAMGISHQSVKELMHRALTAIMDELPETELPGD